MSGWGQTEGGSPTALHIEGVAHRGARIRVGFHGVRGSTPCSGDQVSRIGGNTSCVSIERDGHGPIILDMGTGIRPFGGRIGHRALDASVLVSHLHWDHVQGLPFFPPLHHGESHITVVGPSHGDQSLGETFRGLMQPPYFPVCSHELPGAVSFTDAHHESLAIGDAKVMVRPVPHVGRTNGYRIDIDGVTIAYIPDHRENLDDPTAVADSVLELCEGAHLVIHDSQFTRAELQERPTWGHCTPQYALEVAAQAGAAHLALFHHDPWHDDDAVDALCAEVAAVAPDRGVHGVVAAAEHMTIDITD